VSAFVESIDRARQAAAPRAHDVPSGPLATRLEAMRADGFAAFEAQGLPTRRDERWKGTNVSKIADLAFERVGASDDADNAFAKDPRVAAFEPDLLFVDGRMVQASAGRADLPEGIRILSLAEASAKIPDVVAAELGAVADPKADPFVALNGALFEDAAVVVFAPKARPARPLRILSVASASNAASAHFSRLLFVAGASSQGLVAFGSMSEGDGPGFTSLVSEFRLEADAKIASVELQTEAADRVHLSQTFAALESDANFASTVVSLSEGLVRSEISVTMQAEGGSTLMNGFFLGRGDAHHDHFTTVDHAAPHCTSDEEYRGVLADDSEGVFRGRVIVRPDAQKTDARQSNPNLLLSEGASIDTKPQLEIYADDVKASHGSTIGQLDDDALFFLRARGIDEEAARLLLTRAFAQKIVDGIFEPGIRALVSECVDDALARLEERST